jgi:hypothetical protein
MEAWQLLHGNIPSVIGGGETGNSCSTPIAKETKQSPARNANTMTDIVLVILYRMAGGKWLETS